MRFVSNCCGSYPFINYLEHALKKKTHAAVKLNFLPRLSESSQRKRKKEQATVPNHATCMTASARGRLKRKKVKKKRERTSVSMTKVREP